MSKKFAGKLGFTLVEIMIVVLTALLCYGLVWRE